LELFASSIHQLKKHAFIAYFELLFNLCGLGIYVGKERVLMGEIETFDHYHPPKCQTEGTRSTPYYSTKRNYLH